MSNIKIKYLAAHVIAAILMTAASAVPASAKKNTMNFDGATTSGFNAMDYRLQKPLGNPSFPAEQNGLGKNFFLGFNAGGQLMFNSFSNSLKPGGKLGLRMGSWFTPIHGIRIGADAGINRLGHNADNSWYAGVHADYLMNVTNLLRGYRSDRRFELIGVLGVQLQRDRENKMWSTRYGITTSIQTRFNVQPSMYLYLEPQLSLLSGHYDATNSANRLRANLALNLGIGYRVLTGRLRSAGSEPFRQQYDDNLYFGGGAGAFSILTTDPKIKYPFIHTYVGKMLSSTSGLEVAIDYGYYKNNSKTGNQHIVMGSLDYALNLNNAFGGYRPDETFQMILNLGVTGATVSGVSPRKIYPGVHAGLMGLFRLSPNWGIYLHPQVYGFGRSFYSALNHTSGVPMLSFDLGLRYTIGKFSILHENSRQAYDEDTNHWFITAGGGAYHRLRGGYGNGGNAFFGFGKRFTPVSSWRVNFDGMYAKNRPYADGYTIHADYLVSLTTGMCGYNPGRIFDLQALAGVFGGMATYAGPHKPTMGLEAGLQANFRLNSSLDLFLEPQALATYGPGHSNAMVWVPDVRVQLGLRYKLGTPAGERGQLAKTVYGERRNFVGIAFGPSEITTRPSVSKSKMNINGFVDVNIGRWFSMVSALRGTFSNDILRYDGKNSTVSSLHLDYMLNITSLMNHSDSRRFHILGIVGAGVAFSNAEGSLYSPMATGGIQFRYNLPGNFDIHLEPGVMAWPDRVMPSEYHGNRFVVSPRVSVGTSYRF